MLQQIATILFCTIALCLFGQSNEKMVIARYKNGSVFIGEKIAETEKTVTIRVKNQAAIEDENYENIITLEPAKAHRYFDSNNALIFDKGKYLKTAGTYGIYAFGVGLSGRSAQIDLTFGYRLKKRFAVGFGLGFDLNEVVIDRFAIPAQFLSFFADSKYYLTNGKIRLFASGKFGYGIPFPVEDQDRFDNIDELRPRAGIKLNLGLGVHFSSRRDVSYMVSIENYFQEARGAVVGIDALDNPIFLRYDLWIKRLILKFEVDI